MRSFLVVDDDEDVLFLLEANLQSLGQRVRSTSDLAQARKFLDDGAVDVLIVDISMPDLGGPEFVADLRRDGIEPPHVFLLSALPPRDIEAMADELGVQGIAKPFTTASLRLSLAGVLSAP